MISLVEVVLKRLPAYRSKADTIPEGDDLRPRLGDFIRMDPAERPSGWPDYEYYGVIVVDGKHIPRILVFSWEGEGVPDAEDVMEVVHSALTLGVDEVDEDELDDLFPTAFRGFDYKDLCHLTDKDTLLGRLGLPDTTPLIPDSRKAIAEAYLKDYRYDDGDMDCCEDEDTYPYPAKVGDVVVLFQSICFGGVDIIERDGIIAVDAATGIPFLLIEGGGEDADCPAVLEAMEHEGSIGQFLKKGFKAWDISLLADWDDDGPFIACRHDTPGFIRTGFGFDEDSIAEYADGMFLVVSDGL